MNEFDLIASTMVEREYQLTIQHNHLTMKWYAYFARKGAQTFLFDDEKHWETESDTPTEAIKKLAARYSTPNMV